MYEIHKIKRHFQNNMLLHQTGHLETIMECSQTSEAEMRYIVTITHDA